MHKELITYLRDHAFAMVELARKESDPEIALQLEAMAVELLKRARQLDSGDW
jgi:hypothetical protein